MPPKDERRDFFSSHSKPVPGKLVLKTKPSGRPRLPSNFVRLESVEDISSTTSTRSTTSTSQSSYPASGDGNSRLDPNQTLSYLTSEKSRSAEFGIQGSSDEHQDVVVVNGASFVGVTGSSSSDDRTVLRSPRLPPRKELKPTLPASNTSSPGKQTTGSKSVLKERPSFTKYMNRTGIAGLRQREGHYQVGVSPASSESEIDRRDSAHIRRGSARDEQVTQPLEIPPPIPSSASDEKYWTAETELPAQPLVDSNGGLRPSSEAIRQLFPRRHIRSRQRDLDKAAARLSARRGGVPQQSGNNFQQKERSGLTPASYRFLLD